MTKRQRLDAVIAAKTPDRPPTLGGWIADPNLIIGVTNKSKADYNACPEKAALEAYRMLETDGLIDLFVTKSTDEYRFVDGESYAKADKGFTYEEVERTVEELSPPEEYEKAFDFETEYAAYKKGLLEMQRECGDIVYMPANWNAGARACWFFDYGYENFFLLAGLRPDLCAKLFSIGGAKGYCQGRLVAKAVQEGIYPKAVLFGEDICAQRGPMVSVDLLKEHYAPALAHGVEPLLEVGCKPVWHSDGDVRELIPMLIDCGIQGFQGFQPECGMLIEDMVKLRAKNGDKLLIFGPFAVTTELPVMTPAQIRERVRYVADLCKDKADLVFFTSNTVTPDVPLDNLLAMYDEIRAYKY